MYELLSLAARDRDFWKVDLNVSETFEGSCNRPYYRQKAVRTKGTSDMAMGWC